jgi:hypothetical protein
MSFFLWATALWLAWPNALAGDDPPRRDQGLRVAIDSLYVGEGALRVNFHADSAVTEKLLDGLRRGLTASITYKLQLWHKRLFSDLGAEQSLQYKATFDNWEQKYVVVGAGERRVTSLVATLREKWTMHRHVRLVDIERLQPGRTYYLIIEAVLEPVSKENLREIRGWLSGEVKSAPERLGKLTKADSSSHADGASDSTKAAAEPPGLKQRVFETLMNLIGFGGKTVSARTENFRVEENAILWQR